MGSEKEGDPLSNKKRKLNDPPLFTTSNKFQPLAEVNLSLEKDEMEMDQPVKETIIRPPPIYVSNVNNRNGIHKNLSDLGIEKFKHITNHDKVKISVETVDDYRKIQNYLKSTNAEFHSFQLRSERNFRVVIRGLHPSSDPSLMMDELKTKGYEPVQMVPVYHPVTKKNHYHSFFWI